MRCPFCGAENEDKATFCYKCSAGLKKEGYSRNKLSQDTLEDLDTSSRLQSFQRKVEEGPSKALVARLTEEIEDQIWEIKDEKDENLQAFKKVRKKIYNELVELRGKGKRANWRFVLIAGFVSLVIGLIVLPSRDKEACIVFAMVGAVFGFLIRKSSIDTKIEELESKTFDVECIMTSRFTELDRFEEAFSILEDVRRYPTQKAEKISKKIMEETKKDKKAKLLKELEETKKEKDTVTALMSNCHFKKGRTLIEKGRELIEESELSNTKTDKYIQILGNYDRGKEELKEAERVAEEFGRPTKLGDDIKTFLAEVNEELSAVRISAEKERMKALAKEAAAIRETIPLDVSTLGLSKSAEERYELLEELGKGGMGVIYKARDKVLEGEIVALKVLREDINNNPLAVKRFVREARLARSLNHPNIVRIYDLGEEAGRKYISMEYIGGKDLSKEIKDRNEIGAKISYREAITIVHHICEALDYAHAKGIVHRDIKPSNIMITRDKRVKVTDFGIAYVIVDCKDSLGNIQTIGKSLTSEGAVIGTWDYMAPEQREEAKDVDQRADIYSLGVLFYEMLTGEKPIGRYKLPSELNKDVPSKIDNIILKCLESSPENRYGSVTEIIEELNSIKLPETISDIKTII